MAVVSGCWNNHVMSRVTAIISAVVMLNGERVDDDRLQLDTNPLLMDAISAVKYLAGKMEQLQNIIAELKASNA
ncbi:hypothetical protein RAM73_26330 (plasmid) [Klebsiella pneumoniae]|uniref:Uncharacterized protein n=11 Tax=Enterobacteriaceae TaxID=543 RepID=A0A7H0EVF6_KLEVA|nr:MULTISPECIES: hypothetical protein [Enterobacteriaceae]WCL22851.1 Hypothetical protein [Klebsiella michiganensis]EIY1427899.1 hypothetical protein [Klebsiella pneumoniae]EJK8944687.1 hypothetical protein [Klebsiella pneumoniae]EJR0197030.1 hypothetical protein [Klebsiella pneumoniae]EJR0214089.1 hypothetical protein [Klebsiella pneumoniae]